MNPNLAINDAAVDLKRLLQSLPSEHRDKLLQVYAGLEGYLAEEARSYANAQSDISGERREIADTRRELECVRSERDLLVDVIDARQTDCSTLGS